MSLNKFKESKRGDICRRLGVDIWNNFKRIRGRNSRAFRKFYKQRRRGFRPNTFMFRIDNNKPEKPRKNYSMYGLGMLAKQQSKYYFGNMPENQFKKFFFQIRRYRGDRVVNLIRNIESRLLMIVMRSGLFSSPYQIKQLILHGHIFVNKLRMRNYYFKLNIGDFVDFSPWLKRRLKRKFTKENLKKKFLIPPERHLIVSYRIFRIVFSENPKLEAKMYPPGLDIYRLLSFYKA